MYHASPTTARKRLRLTPEQERLLAEQRAQTAAQLHGSPLRGKFLEHRIDDETYLNFTSLMLENLEDAAWNLSQTR